MGSVVLPVASAGKLALEYVQALVWPVVAAGALFYLRHPIRALLKRIADEGGELEAIGVRIQIAQAQQVANLAKSAETADPDVLRKSVKRVAADLTQDQFRTLASSFYGGTSVGVREQTASAIADLADTLSLDDLLGFAASRKPGERVGAAVALGAQIRASSEVCRDPRVRTAVGKLLEDPRSRVRYRAVEAAQACPELATVLAPKLRAIGDEDESRFVKKLARSVLGQQG